MTTSIQEQSTSMCLPKLILDGHTGWITTVAEIESGKTVISSSADKTLKLWSITDGTCIWSVDFEEVLNFAAVVDENSVVTVSGGSVFTINLSDGQVRAKAEISSTELSSCIAVSEKEAVVGDYAGNMVKLNWENDKIRIVKSIEQAHEKYVFRARMYGDKIATTSTDNTVKLWEPKSLSLIYTLRGHTNMVNEVSFNNEFIVTSSDDTTIRVYNINTSRIVTTITTHTSFVNFVSILPDKNVIVSATYGGIIAFHTIPSGQCIATYNVGMTVTTGTVLDSGLVVITDRNPYNIGIFDFDESRQSNLEIAFANVLSDTSILTLQFVIDNIRAQNVRSVTDLYCGHNLVLFAIRCGVITVDQIRNFNEDLWFFEENLYYPACKLLNEDANLLYPIFYHAQKVGIIREGHSYRREHKNRVDAKLKFEALQKSITSLSFNTRMGLEALQEAIISLSLNTKQQFEAMQESIISLSSNAQLQFEALQQSVTSLSARLSRDEQLIEQRLGSIEQAVEVNAKNFTNLFQAIKKKEKRMKYAGFAKVLLSMIPVFGKAFGEAAYSSSDVLFSLSAEDIVGTGIEASKAQIGEVMNVDLSNAQVTYCMLSKRKISMMSSQARTIITKAVSRSDFKSIEVLRNILRTEIVEVTKSEEHVNYLDLGSPSWTIPNKTEEITLGNVRDMELTVRRLFKEFAEVRGLEMLSILESTEAMNMTLRILGFDKSLDENEFERDFVDVSEELDVTEDAFVNVFHAILGRIPKVDEEQLIQEYCDLFDSKNKGRSSTGLKFATRMLRRACENMKNRDMLGDKSPTEIIITEEKVGEFDKNGDGKVDKMEFVDAGLLLVHGIARN